MVVRALQRVSRSGVPICPRCQLALRQIHTSITPRARAAVAEKPSKSSSALFDLPRFRADSEGNRIEALDPWIEAKRPRRARIRSIPASPSPPEEVDVNPKAEEDDYLSAVVKGEIPDTALAKQVYLNWRRFPDCIILTRVGKFYEVRPR